VLTAFIKLKKQQAKKLQRSTELPPKTFQNQKDSGWFFQLELIVILIYSTFLAIEINHQLLRTKKLAANF